MGRRRLLLSAALLALVVAASPAAAASFPPHLRFRSIVTPRATVHYHQGLEALARQAATLATEILEGHERRYGFLVPRVQIVLSDVEDDPNGFASPLPYPLVGLRVVAPTGGDEFGGNDGWLRLVMTHELAHIVHLEEARGVIAGARRVVGRAPFLFPNAFTPPWLIEGLATYEETEDTAFGRGRNPDVEMVLRMAALEGQFPGLDEAVTYRDAYPGGTTAYYFGEAFLRDLTRRFGPSVLPELARAHSGRVIPYLDELTAKKVTGATFTTRWREWKETATAEFVEEAARIEGRGLTESRPLTTRGIRQSGARFSPDGRWIAYTNRSLTRHRAIHLVRPDGTGDHRLLRRNDGQYVAWTPDGRSIVFDESEVHRRFTVKSDLRVADVATRRVRRLTRGARARDPDVAPDGSRVVFVHQLGDRSELATIGIDGRGQADLTKSAAGVQWARPRWSPDGRTIAASRLLPMGELDIVLVDVDGAEPRALMSDRAKDVEPAWTPDGKRIVFRSDRDGVSNLYSVAIDGGAIVRLTNVVGGAFAPDVSPDGATVAFSRYRAAGYDVHVMPLDVEAAPEAAPFVDPYPPSRPTAAEYAGPDRVYRPFPALLPQFWTPYFEGGDEFKLGAATGGADPLFRHVYGTALEHGFDTGRFGFHGFYQYDRWLPTLLVTLRRHERSCRRRRDEPFPRAAPASHGAAAALPAANPVPVLRLAPRSRHARRDPRARVARFRGDRDRVVDDHGAAVPVLGVAGGGSADPRGVPRRRRKRWGATSASARRPPTCEDTAACSPTRTRWPCASAGGRRSDSRRSSARTRWAASRTVPCSTWCRRTTRCCGGTSRTRSAAAGSPTPTPSTGFPSLTRSADTGLSRCSSAISTPRSSSTPPRPGAGRSISTA